MNAKHRKWNNNKGQRLLSLERGDCSLNEDVRKSWAASLCDLESLDQLLNGGHPAIALLLSITEL